MFDINQILVSIICIVMNKIICSCILYLNSKKLINLYYIMLELNNIKIDTLINNYIIIN